MAADSVPLQRDPQDPRGEVAQACNCRPSHLARVEAGSVASEQGATFVQPTVTDAQLAAVHEQLADCTGRYVDGEPICLVIARGELALAALEELH